MWFPPDSVSALVLDLSPQVSGRIQSLDLNMHCVVSGTTAGQSLGPSRKVEWPPVVSWDLMRPRLSFCFLLANPARCGDGEEQPYRREGPGSHSGLRSRSPGELREAMVLAPGSCG